MQSKIKLWFIITIILGIAVAFFMSSYLGNIEEAVVEQTMTAVVVATQKIPQGTRLTEEMLAVKKMPLDFAHPKALADPSKIVNQFAAIDFLPEQPVLAGQLFAEETSKELPYKIPAGKRAITIAVNPPIGVGGHLKPGHMVDVLVSYEAAENDLKVITLLQDVLVLAIGEELQKKEAVQPAEHITLAIAPEEAQNVFLAESVGKIKLVLRPADKEPSTTLKATDLKKIRAQFE